MIVSNRKSVVFTIRFTARASVSFDIVFFHIRFNKAVLILTPRQSIPNESCFTYFSITELHKSQFTHAMPLKKNVANWKNKKQLVSIYSLVLEHSIQLQNSKLE